MILAGDVGGTKTHLALYAPDSPPRRPKLDRKAASHDHASLDEMVAAFLAEAGSPRVTRAVFGIAGVVVGNRCETTNLPWHVDGEAMGRGLNGARVTLVNDLAATAHGLGTLGEAELDTLQPGAMAEGTRAVLAAGTGLGMVSIVRDGSHDVVAASEGGHADFAPRTDDEVGLLAWLRARHGRVSVERVLSGRGVADLYRYLTDAKRGAEPDAFAKAFAAADDPAAVVTEAALAHTCERAEIALGLFVDAYGAEAGNLALRSLPIAGLYIGGGIAPRIRAAFHDGRFLRAFRDKAPMTALLERIPVHLILDPQTALWGAASLALSRT